MKNSIGIILAIFIASFFVSEEGAAYGMEKCSLPKHSDGKPMLILGGELGNSSATTPEDIRSNLKKISAGSLNTVLAPAYWELIEPQEGEFDFSLVDALIDTAAENGIKLVVLWFGAWKNSMSCYAPEWIKRDQKRFPRARTKSGKALEILSAFSPEVLDADLKAFKSLLHHIKNYDKNGTVIMVQVENEIGMLEDPRDFSDLAAKEFSKGVPGKLMKYLNANKANLHPALLDKWGKHGFKNRGGWKEVFGEDIYTDEYFTAWNYATYVETLAAEGKRILNVPFYLNAALNSRDRIPGQYPSGGPLAHLKDIWHAGAPSIDFLSPDIYDSGFENWAAQYALPDNMLFIPEVRRETGNGAQAYYIIGHHNAIGISPFAIDNGDDMYYGHLSDAYTTLQQLSPLFAGGSSLLLKDGVLLSVEKPETTINDDSVRITLSHYFTLPWDPRAADRKNWNDAGAVLLKIADEEYLLAGSGVVARFEDIRERKQATELGEDGFASSGTDIKTAASASNTPRIGLALVEEIKIDPDGTFHRLRTLNGDETHQGRHVRIGVDDHKILHIKTYKYE